MDLKKKKLLVSQELSFAKTLAGNDKTKRDRALKKLHRWLYGRTHDGGCGFNEEDFMRIWKGLFYCMWMSDKPLVQEEVAENISNLIHSIGEGNTIFVKCFFLTIAREWNGIDQHRLDKFQMLIRRFLRQTMVWARKADWAVSAKALTSVFEDTILKPNASMEGMPVGLILHFSDIFMEELAKIVDENGVPPESDVVIQLLRPFARLLARNDDPRLVSSITETVFNHLMRQSDVGLDYEELRAKGWLQRRENMIDKEDDDEEEGDDDGEEEEDKEAEEGNEEGAEGDEEDIEDDKGSEESEEDNDDGAVLNVKDPRAGRVDVVLPQLDVDFNNLAEMLEEEVKFPSIRPKLKNRLEDLARKFKSITRGKYPLQIGTIPADLKWDKPQRTRAVRKAALKFLKEDEELLKEKLKKDVQPPKKKQAKLTNGTSKGGQEERKGRKRKRGKRKPRSERRKAAKNKLEGDGKIQDEDAPPPLKKKRSSVLGVTKASDKEKPKVNKSDIGEWCVENIKVEENASNGNKNSNNAGAKGGIQRNSAKKEDMVNGKVGGIFNGEEASDSIDKEEESMVTPSRKRRSVTRAQQLLELASKELEKLEKSNLSIGQWFVEDIDGEENGTELKKGSKSPKVKESRKKSGTDDDGGLVTKSSKDAANSSKVKLKSKSPKASLKDDNDAETEIVIKNLRPNPYSLLGRKIVTPKVKKAAEDKAVHKTPSSDKRVKIVLSRNLAQETHEYQKSLRASPAIPFDPSKVPSQGVLKATSSPIMLNPFYRTSPRRQKKLST